MTIKLPKRFYTVEQLAEKWECRVEDIDHLIEIYDLLTTERLAALYGKRRVCRIPGKPGDSKREVLTKVKNFLDKEEVKGMLEKLFGQSVDEYMYATHYELYYPDNTNGLIFEECLSKDAYLD